MQLGLELAHFTLLHFFIFIFLFFIILPVICACYNLHITLILDLVTHCCVCLVFVNGMGGGRGGWDGFCFLPFGYGVETFSV